MSAGTIHRSAHYEYAHPALRSHPPEIADALRKEIQDRLEAAGVSVIEARISHLSYAPEIAVKKRREEKRVAAEIARSAAMLRS